MNGNKLQKSIPKRGLCLKLYSNWMCSSSGKMPKNTTNTFQYPFSCCLQPCNKDGKKNAAALITHQIRRKMPYLQESDTGCKWKTQASFLSGRTEHCPPPPPEGLRRRKPTDPCHHGLCRSSLSTERSCRHSENAPCPSFPATSVQKMNLPLACYQVTLSLLTPTTRHVTLEAPSLEELYGTRCKECPWWRARWGPLRGSRSAEERRPPSQGCRPSRAAAWHSFFSFPLLA